MFGFVRRLFDSWGEEDRKLAEKLGVLDPHPFTTGVCRDAWFMLVPNGIGQEHKYPPTCLVGKDDGVYRLPEQVTLYRSAPRVVPSDCRVVGVRLSAVLVYDVPQRLVRRGCHGRYTLQRSVDLARSCGGDPMCGGGIKHLFPPKKHERLAERELNNVLSRSEFGGVTALHDYCGYDADCYYDAPRETWGDKCRFTVYVGDEAPAVGYLNWCADPRHKYPFYFDDEGLKRFKKQQEEERQKQLRGESYQIFGADTELVEVKTSRINVRVVD